MRISGSGVANNAMHCLKIRKDLSQARVAVSCLHDALLAVAKGKITPEQVQEFFWKNDLEQAKFYGDVLNLGGCDDNK